jgi:hypothetical protein
MQIAGFTLDIDQIDDLRREVGVGHADEEQQDADDDKLCESFARHRLLQCRSKCIIEKRRFSP